MFSALLTLKEHVFEALDNRNFAMDCYRKAALNCFQALNSLLQQLLTSLEGNTEISTSYSPTGAMFIFTTITVSLIS